MGDTEPHVKENFGNLYAPKIALHPRSAFRREPSFSVSRTSDQHVAFREPGTDQTYYARHPQKDDDVGISEHDGGRIRRKPVSSRDSVNSFETNAEGGQDGSSPELMQHTIPGKENQSHSRQYTSQFQESTSYLNSTEMHMLDGTQSAHFECPTDKDIVADPFSWMSASLILLAIFSTIFSGVFLTIALARPRWGQRIGGSVSFANATLLSALFAKLVEISFVTVFVTFLGQALTRRAFRKSTWTGGISIAEMSMRTWITAPGTLITNSSAVRYAALTVLGALTLVAALGALFYTTAAEALVAPKLRMGGTEHRVLNGTVSALFANSYYLEETCSTPIQPNDDLTDDGTTCLQIEHAGQAFHNFKSYMTNWTNGVATGTIQGTTYDTRPAPLAMLYDNTTVQGQWIFQRNITTDSQKHSRFVQNVTMAMPHANIFNAAREPDNNILQPEDLEGSGEYTLSASVPAPAMRALCVGMSESELAPLVYSTWPVGKEDNWLDTWNLNKTKNIPYDWEDAGHPLEWPNPTVVDEIFGFGKNARDRQRAPIFPKFPLPFNTITAVWPDWKPYNKAVYMIATPPTGHIFDDYLLCSMTVMQYGNCTTRYQAALSGGTMSVHCDNDTLNTIPYRRSDPKAPLFLIDNNWKDVASEWLMATSLVSGITDGNTSSARILTQMIPAFEKSDNTTYLSDALPSIGESLNVLGACTLLLSSLNAPFVHYWGYTGMDGNQLIDPQLQSFNASIASRDYASGGSQAWQGIFYVVLIAIFALNTFCLSYLVWHFRSDGQVTDFTEPRNLFALAVNSPPSRCLAGSCGAGPEGIALGRKWQVRMGRGEGKNGDHPHFYVKFPDDESMFQPAVRERKNRKGKSRMKDYEVLESPAVEQYQRLSGRWGTIL